MVDLRGRTGIVERHRDRAHQADSHVQRQVTRAVEADDGHAVTGLHTQSAQRCGRLEHVPAHLGRVVRHHLALDHVVIGDGPALRCLDDR